MNHSHSGDNPPPKPYDFVPFKGRKSHRQTVPGHDRVAKDTHYSGRLVYQLQALTPVFISNGSYALGKDVGFPNEQVIRPFNRVNEIPTIPGSSIKGVARSITEAISPSCLTVTRISRRQLPDDIEQVNDYRNECNPTSSCPACSIFGRMDQLGKVRFGDARQVDNKKLELFRLGSLYSPQAFKVPPSYVKQGQFKGVKFYYHSQPHEDHRQPPVEVLPKGSRVQGQLDFENLTAAELGLLFFALGMEGSIVFKLGGGKPLGLGSLRVFTAELTLLGANHFLSPDIDETIYKDQELNQFVGKLFETAHANKLLLLAQATALAEILAYKPDRQAPDGAY